MDQDLLQKHIQLNKDLSKPASEIRKTLGKEDLKVVSALMAISKTVQEEVFEGVSAMVDDFESTEKPLIDSDFHLTHMGLGIVGEIGELVDALKKHVIYGRELNRANVVEELGDVLFYVQGYNFPQQIARGITSFQEITEHPAWDYLMTYFGTTTEECMKANIDKLNTRYSSGTYTDEAANARADKQEADDVQYKEGPNGYAMYSYDEGKTWKESASMKNEDLVDAEEA